MALSFPVTPSNGQIYTDPNGNSWRFDGIKWDVYVTSGYKVFSGVKLGLTSAHALTPNLTAISFDSSIFDTVNYFNPLTPSRITVADDSYYRINASIYTGSAGASYAIIVKKNGSVILATTTVAANQYSNYDEVIKLFSGDYIELYGLETTSTGSFQQTTQIELHRVGAFAGTSISSQKEFSAVRTKLDTAFFTTTTPTAVAWSDTVFNQNANAAGSLYWNVGTPSRVTIAVTAYYRVKGVIEVSSADSYSIALKKNGTTFSSININPNGYASIDETFAFTSADYLELFVNDLSSLGNIGVGSYLEITRMGI